MEDFKEDIIYIILLFINFLFIFNLVKFSYAVLDFNYLISFSYVLIAVLIFILFKYGIKKIWIKAVLLSIIFILSGYYIFMRRSNLINRFTYDFNIINSNISNNQAISFNNLYIILIITIPLIVAALFLYSRGIYISVPVLTLLFVLFLWYTGYTKEIIQYLFKYTFLNLFTLAVINYIKNRKIFRKNDVKIKTSIYGMLIYGILLAFILSSMVTVMPKEYNGKLISDSYSYFHNKFEKTAKNSTISEKYNISYSGYKDSSTELGGPVKLDKSKALEVYGGNFLYLRGNVKDYYTGRSWISKNNSYKNDNVNLINSNELENSVIASVKIKPIGLITSTVFVPPNAVKVENNDNQVFTDNFGCFFREKPYNTEYIVSYYNGFEMLDDYKNIKSKGYNLSSVEETNYLQVPDTVPQEVFNLVHDIIEKNKAVSDYEKVSCLKKYLEQNYKYTLDVKEQQEGTDFVYNFLFKEKQGYCTYYATALAIMCRIADVPAVYVEGFKQGSSSLVTNNMAHAWVEVNLTGDNLWFIADPSPAVHQNNVENSNIQNPVNNANLPSSKKTGNKNINENPNQTESEKTMNINYIIIIFSLILLISAKVLFILIRKRNMINNDSVIPMMFYFLKRLKRLNIKKSENEGFMEYSERINDNELRDYLILLSKCYYSEAFGNRKFTLNKEKIYIVIENNIKKKKGIIKYYIEKILS